MASEPVATLRDAYHRIAALSGTNSESSDEQEDSYIDPDEALLSRFEERFEEFRSENEALNLEARERGMAIRSVLQEIVDESRDTDRPCHICIFGLMGHGKSRLMNLLITATGRPPRAPNPEGVEDVAVSREVPSGSGCTTRAYSRHILPALTSAGSRFPFFLVDTIGVKFRDEFAPTEAELAAEFRLVRQQLAALDFRSRMGVFRESFEWEGGRVAKGQDVMAIQPEGRGAGTARVWLRGGQEVAGVPLSALEDADGGRWAVEEGRGFVDRRGVAGRVSDAVQGLRWLQPRCQAALLVTNPHQQVPPRVYHEWAAAFRDAGLAHVPVVATHSDLARLFGPEAGPAARAAQEHLGGVRVSAAHVPQVVRLVENYAETPPRQPRRVLSEVQALDALCEAARSAQRREQQAAHAGGISALASSFFAASGLGAVAMGAAYQVVRRARRGR